MNNASFLPEDYLTKKAERRTNLLALTLFGIVAVAVVGAFFVTNRNTRLVKNLNETVNAQYQQKGPQIDEFKQLKKQEEEMLHKAELAGALVERVPRSILLAELINRMPDKLALLEFDMKSERLKAPAAPSEKDAKGRLVTKANDKGKTKQEAGESVQKVETPRYLVKIAMTGVAPTDLEVSRYMQELNAYSLLTDVTLEYSEQKEVEGRLMRQFKIIMALHPAGDVRRIDPLAVPRIKNPMGDELQFKPTFSSETVTAPTGEEGR